MELREALTQIHEIRRQVARSEVFRGYRAATVAFSGGMAILFAGFQMVWLPHPGRDRLLSYLGLWVTAAVLSLLVTGLEMTWRCWQATSKYTREMTLLAVGQFVPSLVAGGLLMVVLSHCAADSAWMLPGLWSILFGLGIFASHRLLPREIFWVGVWYLLAGSGCLVWAQNEYAFSPLAMGLSFGIGQMLAAGILYWKLERNDVDTEAPDQ